MATKTAYRKRTQAQTGATNERPEVALKAQIDESIKALAAEMAQGKSARMQEYLAFYAHFWQYSAGNQMLLAMQALTRGATITRVAGFKTWLNLGYHVHRGETSYRILAPRTFRKTETDASGNETERTGMYFVSVSVFDISQTTPDDNAKPLPSFYYSLGSDEESDALLARMLECMKKEGIRVEWRDDIRDGAQGYSSGGYVALRQGLASRNAVRTLAHEWAHELLHTGASATEKNRTYDTGEWHAESTAYAVCAAFGMHNPFSSDYIQSWNGTPDTLLAELNAIQKAAAHIISAVRSSADDSAESGE